MAVGANDVETGYKFIADNYPFSCDKDQQNLWVHKELKDPNSSIFGWGIKHVQRAVAAVKMSEACEAHVIRAENDTDVVVD